MNLEFHPVANIFPMMSEVEFNNLTSDISLNGQKEPIYLFNNQIIDGRNRYNACQKLGIEPKTIEYQGEETDLVKFIVSLNLHRRHLTESQRAMVAAKLANMRQGERTDIQPSENFPKVSQNEASELLNVSDKSLRFAKQVQQNGIPELSEKVQSG